MRSAEVVVPTAKELISKSRFEIAVGVRIVALLKNLSRTSPPLAVAAVGLCLECLRLGMSKWRNQIWREEEAEKKFAAAREEHCFVEIKAARDEDSNEGKGLTLAWKTEKRVRAKQTGPVKQEANEPRLMKPDAIIGYREYMIGVYEDTSDQLLRKVVEVLRYA